MAAIADGGLLGACDLAPWLWRVAYNQRFEEWHEKSQPRVVDAKGSLVCTIPQTVHHPGEYDPLACHVAMAIVAAFNESVRAIRCPACGYNVEDCQTHGDHDRCERYPYFPWDQ